LRRASLVHPGRSATPAALPTASPDRGAERVTVYS